jgi:hypothetical protein
MKNRASKLSIALLLSLLLTGTAFAQEQKSASAPAPVLTATAKGQQVRFAALGEVRELRLEVFDSFGQKVFDSSFRPGNLLDWHVQDQQGLHLSDGSYLYLVTLRDLSDALTQKYGNILLQQQQISLEHLGRKQLPEAQAQALEASRQSGAQSPVDRVGVEVPPAESTTLNTTTVLAQGNAASAAASSNAIEGTGPVNSSSSTQGRVTKWVDGAGTLGDSGITEVNANVGVGTSNPTAKFHVEGDSAGNLIQILSKDLSTKGLGAVTAQNDTGSFASLAVYGSAFAVPSWRNNGVFGAKNSFYMYTDGSIPSGGSGSINFQTGGYDPATQTRMTISSSGNVGIGIMSPTQKLEVGGNIKLSGGGSGLIFADGSSMTTAGGGGATPSGNSVVNAINDPATSVTINDNRLSGNVARLNSANNWTGANTFNGDQSITGNISATGSVSAGTLSVDANTLQVTGDSHRVGIGAQTPGFNLHVSDSGNTGLRVENATNGGTLASFGGSGDFSIDAVGVNGGRLIVKEGGNVGVGTNNPGDKLSVAGTVSASGGFKFADGSVQTTAVGDTYTSFRTINLEIPANGSAAVSEEHLDLPAGNYTMTATANFINTANNAFQDNSREVLCTLGEAYAFILSGVGGGNTETNMTIHTVVSLNQPGSVDLTCRANSGGTDRSYVNIRTRRLTATRLGNIFSQP